MTVHTRKRNRLLALAIAAALTAPLGVPLPAFAQEGSQPIEEVTVTARRRTESLQDVPLAVSAFSGDDLAKIGALELVEVAQSTPNVTLEVARGTNTTLSAFIRGVGQQDPVAGFEAGVGIYVDDVYLNRPQGAVLDIYDVERIEVLRGPQGTLYGRNTIGGAIKYVTRRLDDEPAGKVRFSAGTDSQLDLVLTGSTPVSDTFRIGGSIASLNRDGFGENLNNGLDNYNKDILAGRVSAEWQPSDTFFLRFQADYLEDDSDPRQGHRLTVGNLTGAPVLDDVFDTRSGLNNPIQSLENYGFALTAEWDINDRYTFKSITAYRDDESFSPIDFDSLPTPDLDVPVVYENDQFSQEFQVLFNGDRWSGVAGFYYLDASAFNAFDVLLAATGDVIGLPGLNSFTLGDVDTETWSVFADFTYDLNDQWSFSIGGRYTDDERSSVVNRQTLIGGFSEFFGGNPTPIATTSDFDGTESFTEFTPRLSVSYRPNDDHNLYASYSEGFKGGGFDPRGLTTAAPDLDGDGVVSDAEVFEFMKFEPEQVDSYEFGVKSTLFDGRMTSNVALFFADYEDVQIPGSIALDTDGDGIADEFIGITTNAADADIWGVEWEAFAVLANDLGKAGSELNIAWTLGYINAEFNEYIDAFGNDVADERVIQNTPEWTASAQLAYEWPVGWFNRSGTVSFINRLSHRDEHSQFETPNPFLDQDTFTLWDLSLVWQDDSGQWTAGIHGKNLTDEEYKVAGYFFPTLGLEGTVTTFYGNPRQVTATVEYRF
ncbi:MAG: TonB-dependent receptor [Pseudomonadota bacterium]